MPTPRFSPRIASTCNAVLGSIAFAFTGVAVYAVARAGTFLTGPREIAIFLGLPLVVAAIALVGTRAPVPRKLKLLLVFFSTGVTLLSVELALFTLDAWREWSGRAAKAAIADELRRTLPDYDPRSFPQLFRESWAGDGEKLYPRIYQISGHRELLDRLPFFPTSNLSNAMIVECFADGHFKIYRSDEYGFGNPPGLQSAKAEVVLVGDSFTAGECVAPEEDIAARMRAVHPRTVNLGIGGAGPLWELANLVEYGLPLHPDVVFWLYYEGNDFADLERELGFPALTGYLAGLTQGLREAKPAVDARVEAVERQQIESLDGAGPAPARERNLLHDLVRSFKLPRIRTKLGLHRDESAEVDRLIGIFERVIVRAKSQVERAGGRFVFVYVPDYSRFVGGSEDFHRERVEGVLARNDVTWIDLQRDLEGHPDVLSLYPHRQMGHFDAAGYAFIARRLLAAIPEGP